MTVLEKNLTAIKLTRPDIAESLQHSRIGTAYKGIMAAKTGEPVRCNLSIIRHGKRNAPLLHP